MHHQIRVTDEQDGTTVSNMRGAQRSTPEYTLAIDVDWSQGGGRDVLKALEAAFSSARAQIITTLEEPT